jgi:hypothetical protein
MTTDYTRNEDGSVTYTAEQHKQLLDRVEFAVNTKAGPLADVVSRIVGEDMEVSYGHKTLLFNTVSALAKLASSENPTMAYVVNLFAKTMATMRETGQFHYINDAVYGTRPQDNLAYGGRLVEFTKAALANGDLNEAAVLLMALHAAKRRVDKGVDVSPREAMKFTIDKLDEGTSIPNPRAAVLDTIDAPPAVPVAEPVPVPVPVPVANETDIPIYAPGE